MAGNVSEIRTT